MNINNKSILFPYALRLLPVPAHKLPDVGRIGKLLHDSILIITRVGACMMLNFSASSGCSPHHDLVIPSFKELLGGPAVGAGLGGEQVSWAGDTAFCPLPAWLPAAACLLAGSRNPDDTPCFNLEWLIS